MKLGRTAFIAAMAASLAACGGDDNSGAGSVGGGVGNTGTCSLSARQDWARDVLAEWYLFPDLLNTNVNKAAHSSVQSYIDAMVAEARAEQKDRYFTYITSIQEENDLINNGSNAGFGIRLSYDQAAGRVFVAEAFENAPAFPAGFDRGTEILSVNGQSTASIMASGGPQAFSDALGPSDPGVTRSFTLRSRTGVESSATVTKAEFSLDPVSDRYGVKILDDGAGGKVGYVNLRTFIVQDAAPQLRAAFRQFQNQGITNVILDLRYNGG
ncbi:MAG: S41 family peptidase, partial [Qipengyuania vulgaris]